MRRRWTRLLDIATTGIVLVAQLLGYLIAIVLVVTYDGPAHLLRNWPMLVAALVLVGAGWVWFATEEQQTRDWRDL